MPSNSGGDLHTNPNQVDYWHPTYSANEATLEYLRDMFEGRRRWLSDDGRILDASKASHYLPQAEAQDDDLYLAQLKKAVFPYFLKDVVTKDIAGVLLNFALDENGAKLMEEYESNVDLIGSSLREFVKGFVVAAIRDGAAFVLVDKGSRINEGDRRQTLADKNTKKDQPYLVLYERCDVINWRRELKEDGAALSMVVLRELATKPDGDFGHKQFERYRVLKADGTYDIYEREIDSGDETNPRDGSSGKEFIKASGTYDLAGIPLVGLSFGGKDPFTAGFPVIEVADLTLDYYRVRSGYRTTLDYMEPTLFAKDQQNLDPTQPKTSKHVKVGANAVIWDLEDVRWIEPSGGGITPKERCLERLERAVEKHAIAFFSGGAPKTATEVSLDASQSESTISGYSAALESAIQEIFKFFADYLGQATDNAGGIVVNKDILKPTHQWNSVEVLEWVTQGAMPLSLAYRILKEHNQLPEGLTEAELQDYLSEVGGVGGEIQTNE